MKRQINELFSILKATKDPTKLLGNYSVYVCSSDVGRISFKTFSISKHSPLLYDWCNRTYSERFWGLKGSMSALKEYYRRKARQHKDVLLMIYLDEYPVAFAEIYKVKNNILNKFILSGDKDYGIHLLLAPYKDILSRFEKLKKGFANKILYNILKYLFQNSQVDRVFAEPDYNNIHACRLAESTGFNFIRKIELPDKIANLYEYKRSDFIQKTVLL